VVVGAVNAGNVIITRVHNTSKLNVESDNLFPSSTINPQKPFSNAASIKNANGGAASNCRYPVVTSRAKYFFDFD